ncbi:MFS transporter [Thermodesulfobacteriota bacterium]
MKRKFPNIYLGWWINISNAIITGLSNCIRSQGFSALFKPIALELGLSRAGASVAAGLSLMQNGIMFAVAGWLSDRLGPKWVIITGTCIMGTGLLLMYFINSVWTFYTVWGVIIGAGHTIGFTVPQDKMLTDWFVSKRGLALGLRFAIIGIVTVILLPVLSWLIITLGWRITCLIWSGAIFFAIPVEMYFVKQRRPEYYGLLPDGAKVEPGSKASTEAMIAKGVEYAAGFQEMEFTLRQAMRTSTYWILTTAWIFYGVIFSGFNVHCIPFITDMGIDPVLASSLMAMMTFFTIPSRLFGGIIADRFRKEHLKFLLMGTFMLMALGIIVFILGQTIITLYIFLILMGLGSGAFIPLDIVIRGRYFGRKSYGAIQGSSVAMSVPITFFSPIYTGWVYDTTGSYLTAFTLFAIMAALNACLMPLIRSPRLPAHINDTKKAI